MAGMASQFDAKHDDNKTSELLSQGDTEFFTSYDELHECFDGMGVKEILKLSLVEAERSAALCRSQGDTEFFTKYDEVFYGMGLQQNFLRSLYGYGFEKPSAIQQRRTLPFLKGLEQAQSGKGKTATFYSGRRHCKNATGAFAANHHNARPARRQHLIHARVRSP